MEKEKQTINAADVGSAKPLIRSASGSLTVRSGEPEAVPEGERPLYEPFSPTGEKILSREEVLAQIAEQETVALALFDGDGKEVRTLNIPPQFNTRFINFHGRKYEWTEQNGTDYQDIGEADAPPTPAPNPQA